MKSLVLALSVIALSAGSASAASAPLQTRAISLQDADVRTFIEAVSEATDVTMIVDPSIRGTVSVSIEGLSREDVLRVFVSTLKAHGIAATPSVGGAYRVYPMAVSSHRETLAALTALEARNS